MDRYEYNEEIILVDENDNLVGFETKLKAHEDGGKLHRAFSIFVFDARGRLLLQRRAKKKYHFGGLWSNTCCGHPKKGEELQDAAQARIQQEFGFDTRLKELFSFLYRASDAGSGLAEHEFDHVFYGEFDGDPRPNPDEIEDWKWVDVTELMSDLENNPHRYTPWFKIAIQDVIEVLPDLRPTTSVLDRPDRVNHLD
ncbi:MAG TPA: isopentenyl-diphosphate Delta-isomerase [Rubrobacteraceae bacterium]|nr:isopentenyl-diphosphate Delta-isomerase [Rubrobacteraceae bacterium]